MCTGGQVVELHCCMCDKTKGLDKFSKAQRRNPDKAVRSPCPSTLNQPPNITVCFMVWTLID